MKNDENYWAKGTAIWQLLYNELSVEQQRYYCWTWKTDTSFSKFRREWGAANSISEMDY